MFCLLQENSNSSALACVLDLSALQKQYWMHLSKCSEELYDIAVFVVTSQLHYASNSNDTSIVVPPAAHRSHASVNQYRHWTKRKFLT